MTGGVGPEVERRPEVERGRRSAERVAADALLSLGVLFGGLSYWPIIATGRPIDIGSFVPQTLEGLLRIAGPPVLVAAGFLLPGRIGPPAARLATIGLPLAVAVALVPAVAMNDEPQPLVVAAFGLAVSIPFLAVPPGAVGARGRVRFAWAATVLALMVLGFLDWFSSNFMRTAPRDDADLGFLVAAAAVVVVGLVAHRLGGSSRTIPG